MLSPDGRHVEWLYPHPRGGEGLIRIPLEVYVELVYKTQSLEQLRVTVFMWKGRQTEAAERKAAQECRAAQVGLQVAQDTASAAAKALSSKAQAASAV